MSVDIIFIDDSDSDHDNFPESLLPPTARARPHPLSGLEAHRPQVTVPKLEEPPSLPERSSSVDLQPTKRQKKGKAKANAEQIQITRQLTVDEIVEVSKVPSTWDVPRIPTAFLVDLSDSQELLEASNGKIRPLDAFIRSEVSEMLDV